jgi:hypothetical protein
MALNCLIASGVKRIDWLFLPGISLADDPYVSSCKNFRPSSATMTEYVHSASKCRESRSRVIFLNALTIATVSPLDKPAQPRTERGLFYLAFPNNEGLPSIVTKAPAYPPIPRSIPSKLRYPVLAVAFWCSRKVTTMLMPKASMHEDHFPLARQNNIRCSGQARIVCPKTKA